jgi:hypothetical protein
MLRKSWRGVDLIESRAALNPALSQRDRGRPQRTTADFISPASSL